MTRTKPPEIPTIRLGKLIYQLPFHNLFRPHTPAELDRLRRSIKLRGVRVRIITYTSSTWGPRCVIDGGGGRLPIAVELGIAVPQHDLGRYPDEDARELAITLNTDRRHLSPDEQATVRGQRNAAIIELHDLGQSLREIGERFSLSHEQVRRILRAAGCHVGDSPSQRPALTPELAALETLQRALGSILRYHPRTKTRPATFVGALPKLLARPLADRFRVIAARHGVPLDGDRWELLEKFSAVVSDLTAQVEASD